MTTCRVCSYFSLSVFDVSKVVVECDEVAVLRANVLLRFNIIENTQSIRQAIEVINFVASIENRQGLKIGCIEEIALNYEWVRASQIKKSINFYGKCEYSKYLNSLIK